MEWNFAPECISAVILCIIWIYSAKARPIPTLKNRLFQGCFLVTFCAMLFNILSTVMIYNLNGALVSLTWAVTTIYFVATPLMGTVYFLYTAAIVFEEQKKFPAGMLLTLLPAALYLVLVAINPFTHVLFDLNMENGYRQGPLLVLTYLVFYIYCLACLVIVLVYRKALDWSIKRILLSFPIVATVVVIVQQLFPEIILTGSAATCALLLIYLNLQNKQISIDYLTGLANRQEFLKMLELRLTKYGSVPFTIVVLSLREFKKLNDVFGQHNGDAFLKAFSQYLSEIVPADNLYRFSGDEFAILLYGDEQDGAKALIEVIRERMMRPWEVRQCVSMMSCSFGIVSYPLSTDNMGGLINGIEHAVSFSKSAKSNGVCFCDAKLLEQVKRRQAVVSILEEKLANNSLDVYYQPVIKPGQPAFRMAEALLRITNTPLGPLYPSEFIPIAEETGLIIDMTYQVLDKVCRFIARMMEQGAEIDSISVNFSALQFTQSRLASKVASIIEKNGIPFSKIKIEITESTLAENQEVVLEFIRRMQERSVHFELDDFGVGYSNIASVLQMPIDIIKLDRSLVVSAVESEKSLMIVENLTDIFHTLGMKVLAEGVETEEHCQFALDCKCDLIQGFYYARPVPEADCEAFWHESVRTVRQG